MRGPRRPSGRRGPVIANLSWWSIDQPALRTRRILQVIRPQGVTEILTVSVVPELLTLSRTSQRIPTSTG